MKLYAHLSLLIFFSFSTLHSGATFGASYQLGKKFCHSPAGATAFGALQFVVQQVGTLQPASKADARAYGIMSKALSYAPVKELYDQAAQTPNCNGVAGRYRLKIVERVEDEPQAVCRAATREIRVRDDASDQWALSFFIFELLNAKSYQKFCQLSNECHSRVIDTEQFAKAIEKIEYANTIEHLALIERCGMGPEYVIWPQRDMKDFELLWEQEIKQSSHAERLRKLGNALAG